MKTCVTAALIMLSFISCKRIEKKSTELIDNTEAKGKRLISNAIDKLNEPSAPDSISIKDFVPLFKKNAAVSEINGMSFELYIFSVNFFVYKANKNIVLAGVNGIVPEKTQDIKSDSICTPISDYEVLTKGVPDEHNKYTKLFWHFRELKKIEAFGCIKGYWKHTIIFDCNSDTVYHMIEEIKD